MESANYFCVNLLRKRKEITILLQNFRVWEQLFRVCEENVGVRGYKKKKKKLCAHVYMSEIFFYGKYCKFDRNLGKSCWSLEKKLKRNGCKKNFYVHPKG